METYKSTYECELLINGGKTWEPVIATVTISFDLNSKVANGSLVYVSKKTSLVISSIKNLIVDSKEFEIELNHCRESKAYKLVK